ncbi:MAG: undecaprenyl-phosphate glucose phosphotransferase [Ardenticatenaceae bacterium]|nr:undecaprenyl-phosphate glucose phosphotransferase [Anaerolineales bacterium]MCB8920988.1 undecaprenyl-phosphate glucose phosphotransferase [Ardenticatenaceae bacterium]MCB8991588.1 undecaprenyl-phosphate glucose phosphotransferase [Ardenticatenaceae bacterium]MCB9004217.1 undecaprenyl-phosphate glucose phosphotransferase [Ardenticatenaceae bacterium]
MTTQKTRTIYTISLFFSDILLTAVAFILAYQLRVLIPWPDPLTNIAPLLRYSRLMLVHIFSVLAVLFFSGQYYIPRAVSRIDQLYRIISGVTLGTLVAVALTSILFKNDPVIMDFPRGMILYDGVLAIFLLMTGRGMQTMVRNALRKRGLGTDRLLVVGTNDTARIILQRILWSPQLGYDLVGVIAEDGETAVKEILGIPVLGIPEDLPSLIEAHQIAEVLIAMPERGHRETIRVISYCERGRVSVKVFPDIFQFVTSEATIDDLGGLPLLSVRDFALRGYLLIFKRLMDLFGAAFGLIFLSPLMLLVAIAIKIESPGPAFFIQERMGLDGKPFLMIKFRSMRKDAEKDGPGWTKDNDPRQTRLGTLLRKVEIDELPNLINVFLGEMSLVGPRPEQAHYVEQFRRNVPHYMDRHKEKGGMTGWAQVNGLRGDTSIAERTKYDLWYSENWSMLLDIKIILRTIWQIFERKNKSTTPVI